MDTPIGFIKETDPKEMKDGLEEAVIHEDEPGNLDEEILDENGSDDMDEEASSEDGSDEDSIERASAPVKDEEYHVIQYLNKLETIDELINGLSEQWSHIKHFMDQVINYTAQLVPEMDTKLSELKTIEDPDYLLFKLIEIIKNDNEIYWFGKNYSSLEALGHELGDGLPEIHSHYIVLVKSGCFTDLFERTKPSEIHWQEALRIQSLIKKDQELALYKLFYLLTKTKSYSFELGTVDMISDFIELLHVHKKEFTKIAPKLLKDKKYLAWIGHKGYDLFIDDWKMLIES